MTTLIGWSRAAQLLLAFAIALQNSGVASTCCNRSFVKNDTRHTLRKHERTLRRRGGSSPTTASPVGCTTSSPASSSSSSSADGRKGAPGQMRPKISLARATCASQSTPAGGSSHEYRLEGHSSLSPATHSRRGNSKKAPQITLTTGYAALNASAAAVALAVATAYASSAATRAALTYAFRSITIRSSCGS